MELVVALLQLLPTGTLEGNLEKGLFACRKARSMGADVALFPEMWSTGYQFPPQGDGPAIPKDHSFLQAFHGLAKELSMAIGITYLEEFSPLPLGSDAPIPGNRSPRQRLPPSQSIPSPYLPQGFSALCAERRPAIKKRRFHMKASFLFGNIK